MRSKLSEGLEKKNQANVLTFEAATLGSELRLHTKMGGTAPDDKDAATPARSMLFDVSLQLLEARTLLSSIWPATMSRPRCRLRGCSGILVLESVAKGFVHGVRC